MAVSTHRGREVTLYEEGQTQHFLDTILIAQLVIPPEPVLSE